MSNHLENLNEARPKSPFEGALGKNTDASKEKDTAVNNSAVMSFVKEIQDARFKSLQDGRDGVASLAPSMNGIGKTDTMAELKKPDPADKVLSNSKAKFEADGSIVFMLNDAQKGPSAESKDKALTNIEKAANGEASLNEQRKQKNPHLKDEQLDQQSA